jgi:hypothetical protein
MPDFIRVRFKDSGTVQTIAKPSAIDDEAFEVLDEDAVDHNGRPFPPVLAERPGIEDQTVAELKDEIARRNEGRDEADQIPAVGNKPDLIAALTADDNREGVL